VEYKTHDLYTAAAIIWKTGIYPDEYTMPDDRGIVSVIWKNQKPISDAIEKIRNRSMRVCPNGFKVIHINLKRKIQSIKETENAENKISD
jgi:hypothetical protein